MVVTGDDMVAGAIFDFASWLTTRPDAVSLGANHDCSVMPPLVVEFLRKRGVKMDSPFVSGWETMLSTDRKEKEIN